MVCEDILQPEATSCMGSLGENTGRGGGCRSEDYLYAGDTPF